MEISMFRALAAIAVLGLPLAAPIPALAADDLRVMQLEQELRTLRREVQLLSQQLSSMQTRSAGPIRATPPPPRGAGPGGEQASSAATDAPAWIDAAKWERVKSGLSELEVISLLGPPTSMRASGDDRVLLYAMEIGHSGFLSGSVTLRERAVVAVEKPVLK
jgi:hypothetical protein